MIKDFEKLNKFTINLYGNEITPNNKIESWCNVNDVIFNDWGISLSDLIGALMENPR